MAKNWTIAEAYKAIKAGDKEAIKDIGRRFPLLLNSIASNNLGELIEAMPEVMTARKGNKLLEDAAGLGEEKVDDGDVEEVEAPKEEKKPAPKKETKSKAKAKKEEVKSDEVEDEPVEEEKPKAKPKKKADTKPKKKKEEPKEDVVEEDDLDDF